MVFLFFVLPILVRVGGRNKNKNKIHLDNFPIELKSKDFVFPSILIQLENGPNEFYFILPIKMAISHQVLSLEVI